MTVIQAFLFFFSLNLIFNCLLAIPIWLIWTIGGIGEKYFAFLPSGWHSIPLINLMGLFVLMPLLKSALIGLKFDVK